MTWLEHRIPPPVYMVLCVGLVWLIDWINIDGSPFSSSTAQAVSLGVAAAGVVVSTAGVFSFVGAETTIDPHRIGDATTLVTGGPYRFTRNPMYLGLTLIVAAAALWLGSLLGLVVGPGVLIAVLTRFQIMPEERMMEELFDDDYRRFRERVPRWIGPF